MAVRRVRRIVRRIDPWTVLKVSLVFNAIAALVFVLGTWVMWSLSLQRGIPDQIVEIFDRVTLTLTVDGELYFRVIVLLAVVGAIVMTGLFTLGAVLYNLIADLVGGVEITVLEETYNRNPSGTRTVLRPVVRTPVEAQQAVADEPPVADAADSEDPERPVEGEAVPLEEAAEEPVPVPVAKAPTGNGDARPVTDGVPSDAAGSSAVGSGVIGSKTVGEDAQDIPNPVGTA